MSQFFAPVGWPRMLFVLLQISLARLVFLAMRINIYLDCTDAVTLNARNLQPGIDIQRRDCLFEELLRHIGIDQRAQEHVAADAGKTIKVGYTHRVDFHHREACTWRQTAVAHALCYNHCFRQLPRGILVSSSGTPASTANPRVSA